MAQFKTGSSKILQIIVIIIVYTAKPNFIDYMDGVIVFLLGPVFSGLWTIASSTVKKKISLRSIEVLECALLTYGFYRRPQCWVKITDPFTYDA